MSEDDQEIAKRAALVRRIKSAVREHQGTEKIAYLNAADLATATGDCEILWRREFDKGARMPRTESPIVGFLYGAFICGYDEGPSMFYNGRDWFEL